jgi:group I intron endonuclease
MIGIYCITNTANGKKYIGQSWDIDLRWRQHKAHPPNDHIQSARQKYGEDMFQYEVIKEIHESPIAQIMLDMYENHYIKHYQTIDRHYGYNKRMGGSNGKLSDEVKAKISESHKGISPNEETRRRSSESRIGIKKGPCSEARKLAISKANKGRKHSPEYCKAQSERMKGQKTGPCSETRRMAIIAAWKKRLSNLQQQEND